MDFVLSSVPTRDLDFQFVWMTFHKKVEYSGPNSCLVRSMVSLLSMILRRILRELLEKTSTLPG